MDRVRLELTPECPRHDPTSTSREATFDGYCGVVTEVNDGEPHGLRVAVCAMKRSGPDHCYCCFRQEYQLHLDEREVVLVEEGRE